MDGWVEAVKESSRERKKGKEKEKKRKEFKIIKIILFNAAQNSTSSAQCPKITKNREYYLET